MLILKVSDCLLSDHGCVWNIIHAFCQFWVVQVVNKHMISAFCPYFSIFFFCIHKVVTDYTIVSDMPSLYILSSPHELP